MKCAHSPVNVANENHLQLDTRFAKLRSGWTGNQKMLEPRRSGDLLFHTVARVLTYVAFATIGAAAVFIFVMVLEHP